MNTDKTNLVALKVNFSRCLDVTENPEYSTQELIEYIEIIRKALFSMLSSNDLKWLSDRAESISPCFESNITGIILEEQRHLGSCSFFRTATALLPVFAFADENTKELKHRFRTSSGTEIAIQLSKNQAVFESYAVIGAMATTGGDAKEAARLLGVTVDFIHERF